MIKLQIKNNTQYEIDELTIVNQKEKDKALFRMLRTFQSMNPAMETIRHSSDVQYIDDTEEFTSNYKGQIRYIRNKLNKTNEDAKKKLLTLSVDKEFRFYPESICDETDITKYDKDNVIVFKPRLEYVFNSYSELKNVIPNLKNDLLKDVRLYRAKQRELPSKEKVLKSKVASKYDIKYKVYAGGGNGAGAKDIYNIHLEGGTFLKLMKRAQIELCFKDKKPASTDASKYLGLELEFICKKDKADLALMMVEKNLQSYICIKDDGSLRKAEGYPFPHEVVILVKESESEDVIKRITQVLDEAGSIVDKNCGFHVHLDMRHRDYNKAFNNLQKSQNILFAMNPSNRYKPEDTSRGTAYSKKIEVSDFQSALEICTRDRYHGINVSAYNKYKTIEIRIHSGTTNFEKINNWVKILSAIVNAEETFVETKIKATTFCDRLKLDNDMVLYIEKRIAKFIGDKGQHITVAEAS